MATGRIPTTANSPLTAKGDLFGYSTTQARVAVGNDGETLVADSSTSTGLRYQGHIEAGKNFIINGGFDIWQRGTSSGSAGYQTADRWYENASNTTTFAQETTTVPTGSRYAFKMTAGATASMYIQQPIETLNAIQLVNQTVTASALVQASVSTGMSIRLYYSTSVDVAATGSWTQITATSGGTATATSGSFTLLSGVYSVPSTAKSLMFYVTTTSTVASGVIVYVGQCQLELGSVPTTFSRAGGTIQGELAACQRYYWRFTGPNAYSTYGSGFFKSTTEGYTDIPYPVAMRVVPTSIDYANLAVQDSALGIIAVSTATIDQTSLKEASIQVTVASGGTQHRSYRLLNNNNAAGYLGLSAEL